MICEKCKKEILKTIVTVEGNIVNPADYNNNFRLSFSGAILKINGKEIDNVEVKIKKDY